MALAQAKLLLLAEMYHSVLTRKYVPSLTRQARIGLRCDKSETDAAAKQLGPGNLARMDGPGSCRGNHVSPWVLFPIPL